MGGQGNKPMASLYCGRGLDDPRLFLIGCWAEVLQIVLSYSPELRIMNLGIQGLGDAP
jgi:hypothetical protein